MDLRVTRLRAVQLYIHGTEARGEQIPRAAPRQPPGRWEPIGAGAVQSSVLRSALQTLEISPLLVAIASLAVLRTWAQFTSTRRWFLSSSVISRAHDRSPIPPDSPRDGAPHSLCDEASLAPPSCERFVESDAREPDGERCLPCEVPELPVRADIRRLHDVLGLAIVSSDGAHRAVDAATVPPHDDLEESRIAGAHTSHDLLVRRTGEVLGRAQRVGAHGGFGELIVSSRGDVTSIKLGTRRCCGSEGRRSSMYVVPRYIQLLMARLERGTRSRGLSAGIETDVILRVQFFAHPQRRTVWTGEQRLMAALLEDALTVCGKPLQPAAKSRNQLRSETLRWFRSDDRSWTFSFLRICESLDLDPGAIRRVVHRRRAGVASDQVAL